MAENLKHLSDIDFDQSISKGVTLVDFYADWCGPCRMIAPIMEELAKDFDGRANIVKIDVDNAQNTALKYNVTSIPTVILFVDGEEVKRVVGVRNKETFQTMLNAAIS